jgi:hypothetical protein
MSTALVNESCSSILAVRRLGGTRDHVTFGLNLARVPSLQPLDTFDYLSCG